MKKVGPEIITFSAFSYDARTGELLRRIRIEPELWASGEIIYRLPPLTTLVVPPDDVPNGRKAVFLESTQRWIVVTDRRGEWWLNEIGKAVQIERLGDPALWGFKPIIKESAA
jgi:hypothetical protein